MHRIRVRYADVAATVALILALGGTAYAAGVIPAGSVGSTQLAAGAVAQPKLAFPLGIVSKEVESVSLASPVSCPSGAPCPPAQPHPITTLTLHVARPGRVVVRVSGAVESLTGATASVDLRVASRGYENSLAWVEQPSGTKIPLSGEVVVPVLPGTQRLTLEAANQTAVTLTHLRMIAMVVPALK